MSTTHGELATCLRTGLFQEAIAILDKQTHVDPQDAVTRIEILHRLGDTTAAASAAKILLREGRLPQVLASRCTLVVAESAWQSGELSTAIGLYHRAFDFAEQSKDASQMCASAVVLLERTTERTGFDSSVPLATKVRRLTIRCGDPHVSVFTHLTFARMEGKAGHFDAARRHFSMARKLLKLDANFWLSAVVNLDESGLFSLCGDVVGALELAQAGAECSLRSGWSRGRAVAAANLAFGFVSLGRYREATESCEAFSKEQHASPSYRLAVADTRARAAISQGEYQEAERILNDCGLAEDSLQRWYDLWAQTTRVRLSIERGDAKSAIRDAERGIKGSEASGLGPLVTAFHLLRAEALIHAGRLDFQADLPLAESHAGWSLSTLSSFRLVLGKAFDVSGQSARGLDEMRRAARVFEASGTLLAAPGVIRAAAETPAHAPPDLESAVALIELAGHPHIMGREAFAILDGAGCCHGLALAAVGPTATRIVAVAGWTEAEALAAVATAGEDEMSVLGQMRDETWRLLARPRAALEHHCTVAAVRKLVATARTLDQYRRDEKQRAALWPAEAFDGDPESIWPSEQSIELVAMARRIAPASLSVLIRGETGTGKEMLARVIHRASDRADRPLQAFNCSAVPRDMLESQLFGYRRGAFTGADAPFPGVIRAAAGGTLFLDEIGEISLDLQPKLLRFLDCGEVHPLGEPHPVKVDVRVIAATNANLERLVADGRFREDLFYRLNVVPLSIPPLRERREEIPPLVQHYLRRFADEQRKGRLTIDDEVLEYLVLFNWAGNLRQLANEVRRMVAFAERDSTITAALLSPEILASRRTIAATRPAEPEVRVRLDQPMPDAINQVEQAMVRRALERAQGRVEDASRLLGISRKGLFLKRRRLGLREAS